MTSSRVVEEELSLAFTDHMGHAKTFVFGVQTWLTLKQGFVFVFGNRSWSKLGAQHFLFPNLADSASTVELAVGH